MDTNLVEFADTYWLGEDVEDQVHLINNYTDFAPVVVENDTELNEEWDAEAFVGLEHSY